jgi:DNA-binding NarL/FixJ family response regulator
MVVERYRFVRDALRIAIEPMPALRLVAEADDVHKAVGLIMNEAPDVILLDVDWPSLDGLAAAPLLRRAAPGACIVMYSSDPEFETADPGFRAGHAALDAGADAYLSAAATLEEMVALLHAVPDTYSRRWERLEQLTG